MTEHEEELSDLYISSKVVEHWDHEIALRTVVIHYNQLAEVNTRLKPIHPEFNTFDFQQAIASLPPSDRNRILGEYKKLIYQTHGIVLDRRKVARPKWRDGSGEDDSNEVLPMVKRFRTKVAKALIYVFIPASLLVAGQILYAAIKHGDINSASDLIKVIIEALSAVLKLALG